MNACAYFGCDLIAMRRDTYLDWRGNQRTDGFCDHHWKEHVNDLTKAEAAEEGKPWKSRAKPRRKVEVKPCGTTAAYQRHMRAGDEPCEPCLAAIRVQNAARRARGKGTAA